MTSHFQRHPLCHCFTRTRAWAIFGVLACMNGFSLATSQPSVQVLTSVMSNRMSRSSSEEGVGHLELNRLIATGRRSRRDAFTSDQVTATVNIHNAVRRLEGASDMNFMIWNSYLARMAQDWANTCNFVHGQPDRDPSTLPYSPIGQNLYAISGALLNVTAATQNWYDEKKYYNYDTLGCVSGQQCGHYTQVVWSASREVGCASSQCASLGSTSLTNAVYFVCNYGPAGNYNGQKPFMKGQACTQCGSGSAWCNNGLCTDNCAGPSSSCACDLKCANCGVLNQASCTCQCKPGWTGNDCTGVCQDLSPSCNANPGWPPSWCDQAHSYVLTGCPAMCGICDSSKSNVTCSQSDGSHKNSGSQLRRADTVIYNIIVQSTALALIVMSLSRL